MEYEIYVSDELYHHGTKGMRWGVRRYQNKDGSLTPAGKRRIKKETEALKKEETVLKNRKATKAKFDRLANKRKSLEEQKKALDGEEKKKTTSDKPTAKKSLSEMSDDELRKAIDRARMEDTYKQLRPEPVPVEKHPLMKKMVNEVLVPAAVNSGKKALESFMDTAVKKALNGKVDPNSIDALTKARDKLKLNKEIKELKDAIAGKKEEKVDWDSKLKEQQYDRNKIRNDREDEAYAEKQAEKQAKKASEAAAKAQERVKEAYDDYVREGNKQSATYRQKSGEREYVNPNQERGLTVYDSSRSNSLSSLTTKPNVSNGKSRVSNLLDGPVVKIKDDGKFATFDEDGRFIGYWSDRSGDVDGII